MYHLILLLCVGLVVGLINAIAGGGAIILYPVLYSLGLPPIVTNATIASSIWPGALSSAYGYRKYIKKIPNYYFLLLIPCLIGSIVGAYLLRKTPDKDFREIVPWLVILAVTLLALQPTIHKKLRARHKKHKKSSNLYLLLVGLAILITAVYGGYFGAGFGIIMLAILGFTRLTDIHQMNGLKNLSGVCISFIASIYFIHYHLVDWHYIPPILIGTIIGGYFGATYSTKVPAKTVRAIIVVIGVGVAAYLFIK